MQLAGTAVQLANTFLHTGKALCILLQTVFPTYHSFAAKTIASNLTAENLTWYILHLRPFLGDRNNQRQTKKDKDKIHPAGQILVGSGLGHVQTVFLHDSTLVVLFTAHLFIYLYFHFHFKSNNRMCFGPPCFPLNFILILSCLLSTRDLQEKTSNTLNLKANRGPWLEWQSSCVPCMDMHGFLCLPNLL